MTLTSIFFSIALIGIVGLYVAKPLLQPRLNRRKRTSRIDRLLIQKEALLVKIGDLDFDHETGKLSDEDYQRQRSKLMAEATEVLIQIDNLGSNSVSSEQDAADTAASAALDGARPAEIDAEIEAAVAQVRRSERTAPPVEIEHESPPLEQSSQRIFCVQCGSAADYGDKFCTTCGHALKQPQHV